MPKSNKNIKYALIVAALYCLNIIFWWIVYLHCWYTNTSNFIINQDFNENTINNVFTYDNLPDSFNSNSLTLTTKQATELLNKYYDTLRRNKKQFYVNK